MSYVVPRLLDLQSRRVRAVVLPSPPLKALREVTGCSARRTTFGTLFTHHEVLCHGLIKV